MATMLNFDYIICIKECDKKKGMYEDAINILN